MAGPYPETDIQPPQAPNLLSMSNQAAQLHNALLQGTGMGLAQHYQRLQALSSDLMGLYTDNNQQPVSRQSVVNAALNAAKNGLVSKGEAATFIANAPTDPGQLQSYVRQTYAGIQNNAKLLGKVMQTYGGGDVNYNYNTNPEAIGGVGTPAAIKQGLPPAAAAAPATYGLPSGETKQTTVGQRAQMSGVNIHSQPIGAPIGMNPPAPQGQITTSVLPPSGPQLGQQAINALTTTPGNALTGNAAAAPQSSGLPNAPSQAELGAMQVSAKAYTDAQNADANYTPNMSTMDEAVAEISNASMGPASDAVAKAGALLRQAGIDIGQKTATATQLVNKATALMARNGTITGDARSDADLRAAFEMTPNASMTPNAAAAAVAIIQGQMMYKHRAIQEYQQMGGKPQDFNKWYTTTYQNSAVSPIILAASNPNMPAEVKAQIGKYIYGLQKTDPKGFARLAEQANAMKANQ